MQSVRSCWSVCVAHFAGLLYNDMFARNEERDLQDDDDERDHNSNMASVIGSCMYVCFFAAGV